MVEDKKFEGPKDYYETDFNRPSVTVTLTIFTVEDGELKALLINRKYEPVKGEWALPTGFIKMDESVETAAERALHEQTGVKEDVYLEQLYTFGEPDRNPETYIITVGYFALVNSEEVNISKTDDVADVEWYPVKDHPELAFDHKDILDYAVKRLRWKMEYTTAAFSFLPDRFTLTDLQDVYETVFDREFDKRNFRKKVKKQDLVEYTGEKTKNVSHRPAKLYRPNKELGEIVEIL